MSEFATPTKKAIAPGSDSSSGRSLAPPPFQLKTDSPGSEKSSSQGEKDHSARFAGDSVLVGIAKGSDVVKKGDKGLKVCKLQQALIDMGYSLPKYGVDGDFGDETVTALLKFQFDSGIPETSKFDQTTINTLDTRFDTRRDYLQAAADYDPVDPKKGTRTLTAKQKIAAVGELNPKMGPPGAKFQETVAGKKYGDEIIAELTPMIPRMQKEKFTDMEPLRADPAKNFHKDADLEGAANAGKDATDSVYGKLNSGPAFVMGTNLIDQWDDEKLRISKKLDPEKKEKAKRQVAYLIDSECTAINYAHNADTGDTAELAILTPIIDFFTDTTAKVQALLETEIGWEGAQLDGDQYLQVFKDPNAETNRLRMWRLFHVSIHEYIHTLREKRYSDWAKALGGSKNHTLIEGFCDFFTMNVRAKYNKSALKAFQAKVEGSFHDPVKPGVIPDFSDLPYASNAEAERMVGLIGINNAQLGYFKGEVELMGKV